MQGTDAARPDKKSIESYNSTREKRALGKICHAPFSSLRFAHSGNVLACSHNRQHILGNISKQSVHDIWFGDVLKELRNSLAVNDFSNGCTLCGKEITTGNFYGAALRNYDYLAATDGGTYPTMLDFEIGNTCNYECIMCNGEYSSSIRINREKQTAFSQVYDKQFVEQLGEFLPHINEARFVGGEPFLIDLHYDIWDELVRVNPKARISVLTNGSLLNQRIIDLFKSGNFNISFSIDSLNKENYAIVRKNGNLERVMNGFNTVYELSSKMGRHVSLNVCAMRQNWHEMPDFVNFCNARNIPLVFHYVHYPFHTSLWNWEKKNLDIVAAQYDMASFPKPKSDVASLNINKFKSLTANVKKWAANSDKYQMGKAQMQVLSTAELKDKFTNKLVDYSVSSEGAGAGIKETIEARVNKMVAGMDDIVIKKALTEMMFIPIEMIAGDMLHAPIERIIPKIKFANGPV